MMKLLFLNILSIALFQSGYGQTDTVINLSEKESYIQIKQNLVKLHSADISESNNDLNHLKKELSAAKIIGLGEVSHGSREIYKMKHRFVKFLIQNLDFKIFSIEANMPEAYNINQYIKNDREDAKTLIGKMGFWTWYTYELKDLVDWFHDYNQNNNEKILFTGFDMQSPKGPVNDLRKILKGTALDSLIYLGNTIDSLKNKTKQNLNIPNRYSSNISFLRGWVRKNVTVNPEWAQQNIRILEQIMDNGDHYLRDSYMAENVNWILRENPNNKIVLWAHNEHIKNTEKSMGNYLKKEHGQNYLSIGFCFFEGSYTAAGSDGIKSYPAQKAYPGTYEYMFNQLQEPFFILNLQNKNLMPEELLFRKTGAIKFEYEFDNANLSDDYDYIIFIKKSSASQLMNKPRP